MPKNVPMASAKMKRHESIRRFVVADAYGRTSVPGNSLANEYNRKYKQPTSAKEGDGRRARKRRSNAKQKKEGETHTDSVEETMARSLSAKVLGAGMSQALGTIWKANSLSTEALNEGMNQAFDAICKKPSSFLAHSSSHRALHDGLESSLNQITENPHMLLAHVATREIMASALDHVGGLNTVDVADDDAAVMGDYDDEFHEKNLLRLLEQAQAILSKHQAARKSAMNGQQKAMMMLNKKGKSKDNVPHTKSFFRKSSSIELIESSAKFEKINASYDALYPPFAKSAGPNLSRYKASCKGDYEGKRLVDKHGTGIGVALESLREAAAKSSPPVPKKAKKNKSGGDHEEDLTRTWPSSAIQQAADSWVEKQRKHVDEARNLKHGVVDKAVGAVDRSLEERAHEVYTGAFEALLARLDMVICVAHCGECRNHVTLRHHEDKYQLMAYDVLSRLMLTCLSWRIPFRVGALTLPRRASVEMQTKQAYNKMKDALEGAEGVPDDQRPSEADLTSLLIRKCCASVPVGSFEVMVSCRDERGKFHYVKLFSKLETQKFPSPKALAKSLGSAIEHIIGVAPEKLLKAFYERAGDEPQLTVPSCAYPEVCRRGCQINNVDTYTLEDLRSPDEIGDLIGIKLQPFEPSELELGLGSTSTPGEVVWVADFSLESKHHLFSVGDIVDVRQVAPLTLSPRRKRARQRPNSRGAVHIRSTQEKSQQTRLDISKFRLEQFYVQETAEMVHPPVESLTRPASPLTRIPSLSETILDIMESRPRLYRGPVGQSHSPPPREGGHVQVYSPVRTAAYLRRTGAGSAINSTMLRPGSPQGRAESLFERGLDSRVPFSNDALVSAPALVPPLKSMGPDIAEHTSPFKVSRMVARDVLEARGGDALDKEEGHSLPLWYNQGFLRGIIRSAHRDGTYDIEYLPQKISRGADDDDDADNRSQEDCGNVYVADSYPTYSGNKTQRGGFVEIGVPQPFVTTVRSRNTLKEEAEMAFTLQKMHEASIDGGGGTAERFVFTHSDKSLSREMRPWRRVADQQKLAQVQARLHVDDGAEAAAADPGFDDDSFGDVDDFLRCAMTSGGPNLGSAVDQRDDKFTPCELQAYAPIAHLA